MAMVPSLNGFLRTTFTGPSGPATTRSAATGGRHGELCFLVDLPPARDGVRFERSALLEHDRARAEQPRRAADHRRHGQRSVPRLEQQRTEERTERVERRAADGPQHELGVRERRARRQ
jgi:hypothetical protein